RIQNPQEGQHFLDGRVLVSTKLQTFIRREGLQLLTDVAVRYRDPKFQDDDSDDNLPDPSSPSTMERCK
ncbi:hypothetical protein L0F63_005863, partial [Massospora cicadina]